MGKWKAEISSVKNRSSDSAQAASELRDPKPGFEGKDIKHTREISIG